MLVKVGSVLDGTVTGITSFGAFVQLGEGVTGLVHISEISHDYVSNVAEYIKKGQKVKVKVLSIDEKNKVSLSIRQAQPKKSKTQPEEFDVSKVKKGNKFSSFEDRMSQFLKDSNERQDGMKFKENKSRRSGYKK